MKKIMVGLLVLVVSGFWGVSADMGKVSEGIYHFKQEN
jgi:hypothetical protein